jgi:hypothetical protein
MQLAFLFYFIVLRTGTIIDCIIVRPLGTPSRTMQQNLRWLHGNLNDKTRTTGSALGLGSLGESPA